MIVTVNGETEYSFQCESAIQRKNMAIFINEDGSRTIDLVTDFSQYVLDGGDWIFEEDPVEELPEATEIQQQIAFLLINQTKQEQEIFELKEMNTKLSQQLPSLETGGNSNV